MEQPPTAGTDAVPPPLRSSQELTNVLVLSYFFPPCNMPAAQRAQSWAKNLTAFGYRPIVVTRKWDQPISHLRDVSRSSTPGIEHKVFDGYEVFYLPYRGNLRDRLYVKYGDSRFTNVRRTLTFLELVLQPFFEHAIPYRNLREFALSYLRRQPDTRKMVVTGNPFVLFRFAATLRRTTGVRWIADYRDAWTTSTINLINKGLIHRLVNRLERCFERLWVSTASCITASSQPIAEGVSALVGREGHVLHNGFVAEDFAGLEEVGKFDDFTIVYVGTLYGGQRIEIFCEAFRTLVDANPGARVRLKFLGLAFDSSQQERVDRLLRGYEAHYECTQRMERREILVAEKRAHLLLHVAWDQHDGIIASKIYEYMASGSFILVTPTDKGAIQEIVDRSGCGRCTMSAEETHAFLEQEYRQYLAGRWRRNDPKSDHVLPFARFQQARRLAELLDRI